MDINQMRKQARSYKYDQYIWVNYTSNQEVFKALESWDDKDYEKFFNFLELNLKDKENFMEYLKQSQNQQDRISIFLALKDRDTIQSKRLMSKNKKALCIKISFWIATFYVQNLLQTVKENINLEEFYSKTFQQISVKQNLYQVQKQFAPSKFQNLQGNYKLHISLHYLTHMEIQKIQQQPQLMQEIYFDFQSIDKFGIQYNYYNLLKRNLKIVRHDQGYQLSLDNQSENNCWIKLKHCYNQMIDPQLTLIEQDGCFYYPQNQKEFNEIKIRILATKENYSILQIENPTNNMKSFQQEKKLNEKHYFEISKGQITQCTIDKAIFSIAIGQNKRALIQNEYPDDMKNIWRKLPNNMQISSLLKASYVLNINGVIFDLKLE